MEKLKGFNNAAKGVRARILEFIFELGNELTPKQRTKLKELL